MIEFILGIVLIVISLRLLRGKKKSSTMYHFSEKVQPSEPDKARIKILGQSSTRKIRIEREVECEDVEILS